MTNPKRSLGEMAIDELELACEPDCGRCVFCVEIDNRETSWFRGAPGRHSLLTVEQVRAVAPKLAEVDFNTSQEAIQTGWNEGIEAFARALLNLSPDDPSPLED